MRSILSYILRFALSAMIALVFGSCFGGLDPAPISGDTTSVTIALASFPDFSVPDSAGRDRAIVQGAAKLYIQTGITAGSATLYGPYDATGGSATVVRDIPPGSYPWIALIYSAEALALSGPITLASGVDPQGAFPSALAELLTGTDSSTVSVALVPDITIARGTDNRIAATLVPVTGALVNATVGGETPYARSIEAGNSIRTFIVVTGVAGGIPSGNALGSSRLILENTGSGNASISNAALYDSSGAFIGTVDPGTPSISAGADVTLLSLSSSLPSVVYLYLEYSGTGYSLRVVNTLATRLIAVTSTGSAYWSENGVSWNGPYATGLTTGAQASSGANGMFAVAGSIGMASSPDGIAWTMHTMPMMVNAMTYVSSNDLGEFLAIGYYSATQYSFRSIDGLVWPTYGTVLYPATNTVAFGGLWYVTTTNGSSWRSSPDGINWTSVTGTGSGMYQLNRVIGINGKLVAGGGQSLNAGTQIQVSSDSGATFEAAITIPASAGYVNSFAVVGTNRLVVGGSGAGVLVSVTDDYGATWSAPPYPGTATVNALCTTPLGLFAGDAAGKLFRSTDGGASFTYVTTFPSAVTGLATRTVN